MDTLRHFHIVYLLRWDFLQCYHLTIISTINPLKNRGSDVASYVAIEGANFSTLLRMLTGIIKSNFSQQILSFGVGSGPIHSASLETGCSSDYG